MRTEEAAMLLNIDYQNALSNHLSVGEAGGQRDEYTTFLSEKRKKKKNFEILSPRRNLVCMII